MVVELTLCVAYPDTFDSGIPHSIIFVNVTNEREVRVILGTVFEIEVYLGHISCWHDSIAGVCACLAFCLAC